MDKSASSLQAMNNFCTNFAFSVSLRARLLSLSKHTSEAILPSVSKQIFIHISTIKHCRIASKILVRSSLVFFRNDKSLTLHKKIALSYAHISILQFIYFENVMKILTFFALSMRKCASWKEISL